MVTKIIKKSVGQKIGFQLVKVPKKHNLQKWTPFSSISNRFRDMSFSLNSPYYGLEKILVKNGILACKSSKKHNLQKWTPYSSISNRFRDMSNSLNSHHYQPDPRSLERILKIPKGTFFSHYCLIYRYGGRCQ